VQAGRCQKKQEEDWCKLPKVKKKKRSSRGGSCESKRTSKARQLDENTAHSETSDRLSLGTGQTESGHHKREGGGQTSDLIGSFEAYAERSKREPEIRPT